jgi:hypothetical protein
MKIGDALTLPVMTNLTLHSGKWQPWHQLLKVRKKHSMEADHLLPVSNADKVAAVVSTRIETGLTHRCDNEQGGQRWCSWCWWQLHGDGHQLRNCSSRGLHRLLWRWQLL